MSAPLLALDGIVAGYGRSTVLHDVSLEVGDREIVCLLGANGAGKSTTLAAISGLLPLSAGSFTFEGSLLSGSGANAIVRRGIAQVPERRQLFNSMTVEENLLLGGYTMSSRSSVEKALSRCYGLFPRLAERKTQIARSMSGGEQQMLAIARALMSRPRVLLLDEPSLGLAPKFVATVLELVRQLRDEGTAILIVEQNAQAALEVADRGYVLATGRIVQAGSADALLNDETVRAAYLGDHGEEGTMESRLRVLANAFREQTPQSNNGVTHP